MTFAEKIRRQRKDKDMGQKEFAQYLGVSLRTLSDYENGKARPRTREAYQRIATTLDVNINYLLNEDDDFIITSQELFGYSGKKGAEKILADVNALFAGGELAEEDKDALMFAIQQSYIDAKRKNKKYAGKKSRENEGDE